MVDKSYFFFGAGYGSRTRLNGLGSRCNTDIPTLRIGTRQSIAYRLRKSKGKLTTVYFPLFLQTSLSGHSPHLGERAEQISRPNSTKRWQKSLLSSGGRMFRSCISTLYGVKINAQIWLKSFLLGVYPLFYL